MRMIAKFLITALSLLLVAALLPGVSISGIYIAVIVALILGVINVTLKPLVILLTLPINIVTLGLFTFVVNGLFLWFVATFVDGFIVDGIVVAILAALIISLVSYIGEMLLDLLDNE